MKIKKFIGPTLKDAAEKMKAELGGDAIILGTRMLTKEGAGGKIKIFEITSGLDKDEENKIPAFEVEKDEKVEELEKPISLNSSPGRNKAENKPDKKIFNIIGNRKSGLETFSKPRKTKDLINGAIDLLLHREIQKPIAKLIVNHLKKSQDILNESNLQNYIVSSISSLLSTSHFELSRSGKPKTVAVVGPTGVGKTTCIAKLAAISKILHNLNIGIISVDTYRLGAIDQLRIFSELSNIDMLVAYEPEDMPKLMKQLKNKDIIFIDTVGRSQKNLEDLKMTKKFLDNSNVDETYLVMSSTSSTKTLYDIADRFKILDYNSFIFSKIDEGVAFGNLLNVMTEFNVPIIYLTNGQVIPDDILSADSEFIANLIYSGKMLA